MDFPCIIEWLLGGRTLKSQPVYYSDIADVSLNREKVWKVSI